MKPILVMLITCFCYSVPGAERFNFNTQVGVVDRNQEHRLCLAIFNPHLQNGDEVSFILPHKPQRMAKAVIEGKADRNCSRNPYADDGNPSSYWLKLLTKRSVDLNEPMPAAIGIVRPAKPVSVSRGTASGDPDGDGRAEFFRICTTSEGEHLTIWSGKPLRGKKRWHSYYYLGYDVVSTCKKKDYQ